MRIDYWPIDCKMLGRVMLGVGVITFLFLQFSGCTSRTLSRSSHGQEVIPKESEGKAIPSIPKTFGSMDEPHDPRATTVPLEEEPVEEPSVLAHGEGSAEHETLELPHFSPDTTDTGISSVMPELASPTNADDKDSTTIPGRSSSSGTSSLNSAGSIDPSQLAQDRMADVFFDFDQFHIREDAKRILERNAELLQSQFDNKNVLIEGHCDERGTREYNFSLGNRRALAVKDYLVDLGVSASRVSVISYGKEKPFCKNPTDFCYQQNRRGRFILMEDRA